MLKQAYKSISSKFLLNLVLIMSFVMVQAVLFSSEAKAAVPYTYTLAREDNSNIIKITFDEGIYVDSINDSQIASRVRIAAAGNAVLMRTPRIVEMYAVNSIDSNEVEIVVGDLDPDIINYEITIEPGVIEFDKYTQLSNFKIAFSSSEFADGFEDVFIKRSASEINDNILRYNAPRDVNVFIPKRYITKIETIHKYNGVSNSTKSNAAPKLTNIDILTLDDVKKVIVNITDSRGRVIMESKILEPRSDFKGFTLGQAGLNIETSTTYKVNIYAYDTNGKLVDKRTIVPRIGDDKTKDFIISDYITSTSSGSKSDKNVTLYDLMKDLKTLNYALTNFNEELNLIKVAYSNTRDYRVIRNSGSASDILNSLADAINDDDVRYIKFDSALNITLPQNITISRPNAFDNDHVLIEGNGATINGNITIGGESSDTNTYELRNMTIQGTLTRINPSRCILTNVQATTIR
ncbi:hypothetical protein [Clostridium sp. HMP27]|uniref:hypothetical protein n=1 Tax=Clostridium sp. HMP27 TaxID=1487921 RepID=UPI00052BA2B6|nr:hypothetical protein [Clostridium sp. HMP27]KGK89542.1 hypothetical protein DP68_03510 [Clostridium sp. HMP27]